MNVVPVVDLQTASDDEAQLSRLDKACRDHGFFLLTNHGITAEIDAMWQASQHFFSQSINTKREVMRSGGSPLGYYDRELTKRVRDQKEVFDYMRPRADGSDLNRWPDDPAFQDAMVAFFDAAVDVASRTLSLVYHCLSSSPSKLPAGDPRTSNVRLNYYPAEDPLDEAERKTVVPLGDMALHHHTDPGILTLLIQDMTGGLQTQSREHGWIDVPPEPGTIVVNLGDALQVWTNDNYVAAVHRVRTVNTLNGRFSTPFFFNPGKDAVLEPLPGLDVGEPRYRSFTWREYIRGRVDDNYHDVGEDDIQIARFRL